MLIFWIGFRPHILNLCFTQAIEKNDISGILWWIRSDLDIKIISSSTLRVAGRKIRSIFESEYLTKIKFLESEYLSKLKSIVEIEFLNYNVVHKKKIEEE